MNTGVMFSSKSMNWATPQDFFDKLNSEFHFTLDPCADSKNHKCATYYTEREMVLHSAGGGKRSSVIRHTEERLRIG